MVKTRVSIGILFFICGMNFASWATRIPDFKAFLHLSDAALGTVLMGLPIGSLVSLPLAGWLLSKYQSHIICLLSVVLYIIIIPCIGYVPDAYMLFLGLFAYGLAGDILNIAMNTQVIRLEEKLSKTVMSSFHAIFSIGLLVGSLLGGILNSKGVTYQNHFYLVASLNALAIPLFYTNLLRFYPEKSQGKERPKSSYLALGPYLLTLALIAFCGMMCEGAMADWITLYFREQAGPLDYQDTIGFIAFASAMVFGRLSGNYLTKKWSVKNILTFNGLFISLGMVITLSSQNIMLKAVGCFIIGLGVSTIVPLIYSQAGNQKKISPSIAIAGVSTIAYVGFLLGPIIIGYLAEFFSLQYALVLLIILGLISSWISNYRLIKTPL